MAGVKGIYKTKEQAVTAAGELTKRSRYYKYYAEKRYILLTTPKRRKK